MSINRIAHILGITFLSLLCWYGPAVAQPGAVFLEPDSAMISTLDTVSIALRVDQHVVGIHCFMVSIDYDTTLLKIVNIMEGPLLKAGGQTFFFWDTLRHPTDIGNCILGYGLYVNGPGVLAVVKFRAALKGGMSPLAFSYVNFSNVNLDSMPVGHSDGKIVVKANPIPAITSSPVTVGTVGQPYQYDVDATGDPVPTYALAAGYPAGMTINGVSGLIQWTPLAKGDYPVTVQAVNVVGTATQSFTIHVKCCVGVTGNVNGTGIVDLSDLSALVSYLTGGGYILPCSEEANVNGAGIVDLSDLSALVSYLTGGGYVLPSCP